MRTFRTAFPLLLTAASLAAVLGGCQAEGDGAMTKEVADLRADLAKVRKDNDRLESALAAQTRRVDGLTEDLSHVRQLAVEVKAAPAPAAQVAATDGGAPGAAGASPTDATAILASPQGLAVKSYLATEEGRKVVVAAIEAERDAAEKERDQRRVNGMVERFAKQANLTEDQTKRMKDIMGRAALGNRDVWTALRELGPDATSEQRDEVRQQNMAKTEELRKKTDDEVHAVLDSTQYEMYQQEQDKLRAAFRGPMGPAMPGQGGQGGQGGRRGGRGGGGGGSGN